MPIYLFEALAFLICSIQSEEIKRLEAATAIQSTCDIARSLCQDQNSIPMKLEEKKFQCPSNCRVKNQSKPCTELKGSQLEYFRCDGNMSICNEDGKFIYCAIRCQTAQQNPINTNLTAFCQYYFASLMASSPGTSINAEPITTLISSTTGGTTGPISIPSTSGTDSSNQQTDSVKLIRKAIEKSDDSISPAVIAVASVCAIIAIVLLTFIAIAAYRRNVGICKWFKTSCRKHRPSANEQRGRVSFPSLDIESNNGQTSIGATPYENDLSVAYSKLDMTGAEGHVYKDLSHEQRDLKTFTKDQSFKYSTAQSPIQSSAEVGNSSNETQSHDINNSTGISLYSLANHVSSDNREDQSLGTSERVNDNDGDKSNYFVLETDQPYRDTPGDSMIDSDTVYSPQTHVDELYTVLEEPRPESGNMKSEVMPYVTNGNGSYYHQQYFTLDQEAEEETDTNITSPTGSGKSNLNNSDTMPDDQNNSYSLLSPSDVSAPDGPPNRRRGEEVKVDNVNHMTFDVNEYFMLEHHTPKAFDGDAECRQDDANPSAAIFERPEQIDVKKKETATSKTDLRASSETEAISDSVTDTYITEGFTDVAEDNAYQLATAVPNNE